MWRHWDKVKGRKSVHCLFTGRTALKDSVLACHWALASSCHCDCACSWPALKGSGRLLTRCLRLWLNPHHCARESDENKLKMCSTRSHTHPHIWKATWTLIQAVAYTDILRNVTWLSWENHKHSHISLACYEKYIHRRQTAENEGLPLSARHVTGHAQSPWHPILPAPPPQLLMTKVMTTNDSVDFHYEIRAGALQWDHESFPADLTPLFWIHFCHLAALICSRC